MPFRWLAHCAFAVLIASRAFGASSTTAPAEPPTTDLIHRVDYLQWFRKAAGSDRPDNAYNAYRELLKAADSWTLSDMLNGTERVSIQPWKPSQHPRWEAAHQAMKDTLLQFQLAAQKPERFSTPILFDGGDRPMVTILMVP